MLKSILSTVFLYEIYLGTQTKRHPKKKTSGRHIFCKVLSIVFVYELK
jgi:hypothetical protein